VHLVRRWLLHGSIPEQGSCVHATSIAGSCSTMLTAAWEYQGTATGRDGWVACVIIRSWSCAPAGSSSTASWRAGTTREGGFPLCSMHGHTHACMCC
jgi:hypothetical protein